MQLSQMAQDHLTVGSAVCNGLGSPISITNQENASETCPRDNLMKAIPQLKVPSPTQLLFVPKSTNTNQPSQGHVGKRYSLAFQWSQGPFPSFKFGWAFAGGFGMLWQCPTPLI